MDYALQRIDAHALGCAEQQPWRKEQVVRLNAMENKRRAVAKKSKHVKTTRKRSATDEEEEEEEEENCNDSKHTLIFRNDRLRSSEPLPFEVIHTQLSNYYLSIPVNLEVQGESQAPFPKWVSGEGSKVIAINPSVQTPFVGYDLQGYVYKIGGGDFAWIHRLCNHLDHLQSQWSQPNVRKKQRYQMRQAGMRMRWRIRNLVDELHCKTAAWLCESYHVILYPHYETSMVSQQGCRQQLSSKTARAMLTWAHHRFQQHLLHKIREYPLHVVLVDKSYTSKTCTECGHVKRTKFQHRDMFECDACAYATN